MDSEYDQQVIEAEENLTFREKLFLSWSSLRPWREIATLSLILMETTWAALWYATFPFIAGSVVSFGRSFLILGGMYLLAYGLAYVATSIKASFFAQRGLVALVLIVSILVGLQSLLYVHSQFSLLDIFRKPLDSLKTFTDLLPPEFAVALVVLFIWWRGISLAEEHVEPINVLRRFRIGIFSFLLYGILWWRWNKTAGLALDFFLLLGLVAMVSTRVGTLTRLRGSRSASFDRRWAIGIGLAVVGIVLLAALSAQLMRSYFIFLTQGLTVIISDLLIALGLLIAVGPLTLFIELIFYIGEWLHFSDMLEALSQFAQFLLNFFNRVFGTNFGSSLQTPAVRYFLYGTILLFLILVVAFLWQIRIFIEKKRKREETQSTLDEDLLPKIDNAFRRGLRALASRLARALHLPGGSRLLAAARIRRIYAHLMDLSEELGHPRPAARTPLEFLNTLDGVFPEMTSDLAMITEAYQKIRYGQVPEDPRELDAVEKAWRRVAFQGKTLLNAQRKG